MKLGDGGEISLKTVVRDIRHRRLHIVNTLYIDEKILLTEKGKENFGYIYSMMLSPSVSKNCKIR